jgi:hypothetical protein
LDWAHEFNKRCLLEPIGNLLPAEAEVDFQAASRTRDGAASPASISLRQP